MRHREKRPSVSELPAVVEEAYRLFACYRPQNPLNVCHCNVCLGADNERALLATPLRRITSELLATYTDSVSAGTEPARFDELRYFLPRYFELIAANDPPDILGLDMCLRRLQEVQWRTVWPTEEVKLIDSFFDAYLFSALANLELYEWPAGWLLRHELDAVLTMIVTAGGDIDRALRVWDEAPDPGAALHMASLRSNLTGEPVRRLINAHLSDEFKFAAISVGAFLSRPEVDERLELAFFALSDARLQKIVSDAMWR